jgi:hypothetical protein
MTTSKVSLMNNSSGVMLYIKHCYLLHCMVLQRSVLYTTAIYCDLGTLLVAKITLFELLTTSKYIRFLLTGRRAAVYISVFRLGRVKC